MRHRRARDDREDVEQIILSRLTPQGLAEGHEEIENGVEEDGDAEGEGTARKSERGPPHPEKPHQRIDDAFRAARIEEALPNDRGHRNDEGDVTAALPEGFGKTGNEPFSRIRESRVVGLLHAGGGRHGNPRAPVPHERGALAGIELRAVKKIGRGQGRHGQSGRGQRDEGMPTEGDDAHHDDEDSDQQESNGVHSGRVKWRIR